jgi:drug/metabolite transporter (DMT)-like permease
VALAGLLYLGAFVGLSFYSVGKRMMNASNEKVASLGKKDLPWLCGATIAGGILAPISMMSGLRLVSGFSASLLLNLEGVATAVIAAFIFGENVGKRLWTALACMTIAGVFLTWDQSQGKFMPLGPLLLVFAMVCWGIDNNLTRNLSEKDPVQIAEIKGLVAGVASLSLALILGMRVPLDVSIVFALLVGAFSYGASLVLFIRALEGLGSSRTGSFFSLAPFIAALVSLVILREWIGWVMFPATGFMIIGVWLIVSETHSHLHRHETMTHIHLHEHGGMHHLHKHSEVVTQPHIHNHTHFEQTHSHAHWPDTHHRHKHTPNGD